MGRKKRRRLQELGSLPNVVDRDEVCFGGEWVDKRLGPRDGLALELGCGKGEYTLALARCRPSWNIVGIDRRGDRLWKGARRALEQGLANVLFLRADLQNLELFFGPGQVSQIWLPFPDPMPKKRQAKHRIFSQRYLLTYRKLLVPKGSLHLKTDDAGLAAGFREAVAEAGGIVHLQTDNLYGDPELTIEEGDLLQIRTTFELRHLAAGKSIRYFEVRFPPADAPCPGSRG
jgi:tRNA (guanine-N7-)-methyltransferase